MLGNSQAGGRAVHNFSAPEGDGHLIREWGLILICAEILAMLDFNALYLMNNCINQALAIYFP